MEIEENLGNALNSKDSDNKENFLDEINSSRQFNLVGKGPNYYAMYDKEEDFHNGGKRFGNDPLRDISSIIVAQNNS